MLKHAIGYLELGWSVFPLKPKDKTPLVKWQAYQTKKPTADEVTAWWKKWPNANIGLATGAISGVVVIDIDSAEGREAYAAEFGELHNTIRQTTGKPGGLHLLFATRNGTKYQNMARTIPFVDVRGDGGYIVVSPSVHPNGTVYQWEHIDPLEMGLDDLMPIPDAVHEILSRTITPEGKTKNEEGWVNELLLMGVEEGARNINLTKLAGYYLRLYDGDTEQIEPILLLWDSQCCRPPLGFKVIRATLLSLAAKRKRELVEEVAGGFDGLTELRYADGTIKYQVRIKGHDGYIQMDYATLRSHAKYCLAVDPVLGVASQPIKQPAWITIVNSLLQNRKIKHITVDETKTGAVISTLKNVTPKTDIKAFYKNNIVLDESTIRFQMSTLIDIFYSYNVKNIDRVELGKILRDLGFTNVLKKIDGKTVRLWSVKKEEWNEKLAGEWPYEHINIEPENNDY